jgi:antitoxin VapB
MSTDRNSGNPPPQVLAELAREHLDDKQNIQKASAAIDAVWDLVAISKSAVPTNATHAHGNLYDEDGLPR